MYPHSLLLAWGCTDEKGGETSENSVRRWEKLRRRDRKERPSGAPALVIITQIQHWNMATMWTLSKSSAPVPVQPIRGDKVRGGGTWGGSERECHQTVEAQQESERQRSSICRRSGLPAGPWRQVGQVFSIGLHDFSWTLWRNTYSFKCPLTDITAHKYYVVGQGPTLL